MYFIKRATNEYQEETDLQKIHATPIRRIKNRKTKLADERLVYYTAEEIFIHANAMIDRTFTHVSETVNGETVEHEIVAIDEIEMSVGKVLRVVLDSVTNI